MSKKSFIMHAIYILLDLLWNFLEVRTQFDCPSQSNPAILYGTIFFFFLENCHLAASPHRGASQQNPYVTKYSSSIRI